MSPSMAVKPGSIIHIVLGLYFIIKINNKMKTNHAQQLIGSGETYPDAAN